MLVAQWSHFDSIPNSIVKRCCGEDTWGVAPWENSSVPGSSIDDRTTTTLPYVFGGDFTVRISSHTLTKVRRRQSPVDKQTLECYFTAFNLDLNLEDYTKPIPQTKVTPDKAPSSKQNHGSIKSLKSAEPLLPEGEVPLGSQFYIERSHIETNSCKAVLQPGSLIRIKAPRRTDKSSLTVRILDYAAQQGCKTVFLSFQLAKTTQPLVLALDDVDRLFDCPELADEFFGLLRTWHEQAKNQNIWRKLRLIVAHSTEVYFPLNVNKSPFKPTFRELHYTSNKFHSNPLS